MWNKANKPGPHPRPSAAVTYLSCVLCCRFRRTNVCRKLHRSVLTHTAAPACTLSSRLPLAVLCYRAIAPPTMTGNFDDDVYGTEKSFGRASQGSDYYGESSVHREGIGRRVMESFKRDPNFNMTPKGSLGADGKVFDVETAAQNTANSPLARKLKGRHLQMIAIGGSIGTVLPRATAGDLHL